MEIQYKIENVGFLSGTFNILKEDIHKSIEKEVWEDILPMDYRPEKIMQSEILKSRKRNIVAEIDFN